MTGESVRTIADILSITMRIIGYLLPFIIIISLFSTISRFLKGNTTEENTDKSDDVSHMFSGAPRLDIDDEDWGAKREQTGKKADESITHDHIRDISLSKEAQIKQLKTLKKAGLLSQEEYLQRLNSL